MKDNSVRLVVISVLSGLLIELFFRLVKYRDSLNHHGPKPKYSSYNTYLSVTEFISGGRRRWLSYLIFRIVPVFIVLVLLAAILNRYQPDEPVLFYLFICSIISLLSRDIYALFKREKMLSEKLIHYLNISLVIMTTLAVNTLSNQYPLASLAPSTAGVVDNLWSSLLVALLIIFYLETTGSSKVYADEQAEENARENYIFNSYQHIHKKYGDTILNACEASRCSPVLLYSVLIYENMNRPAFFRTLENLYVKLTSQKMTVGIAQVMSSKPLSDTQSIFKAAKILSNTSEIENEDWENSLFKINTVLKSYNQSEHYSSSITSIYSTLKTYRLDGVFK